MEFSALRVMLLLLLPITTVVSAGALHNNPRPPVRRLNVQRRKARPQRHKTVTPCSSPKEWDYLKPDPLTLVVAVKEGRKIKLNQDDTGTLDDLSVLSTKLQGVFEERTKNHAFDPDLVNRTDLTAEEMTIKKVYVSGSSSLNEDEVERLVAELKKAGANPVIVLKEETVRPALSLEQGELYSRGVLNGKAINKPEPEYPPEARAAKASGMVAVHVIINYFGEVICAHALSGHPLLHRPAEKAARLTRFPALKLPEGTWIVYEGVITFKFDDMK